MSQELLPCLFHSPDETAHLNQAIEIKDRDHGLYQAECQVCFACGPTDDTLLKAKLAWNRRQSVLDGGVMTTEIQEMLENCESALCHYMPHNSGHSCGPESDCDNFCVEVSVNAELLGKLRKLIKATPLIRDFTPEEALAEAEKEVVAKFGFSWHVNTPHGWQVCERVSNSPGGGGWHTEVRGEGKTFREAFENADKANKPIA